jgi:hypothetical protein
MVCASPTVSAKMGPRAMSILDVHIRPGET